MTANHAGRRARQPRSVVVLYGALVALLTAVLAGVSLSVRPPAPPTIAEFAPQAVQQIKAPPRQQENGKSGDQTAAIASPSPSVSHSTGSSPSPSASPTPTTSGPGTIDETRIKQCSATTQTANPQSAPCVNYYAGTDNGGATAPGVSRDEIRVGYMTGDSGALALAQDLINYFNLEFQFYGRKITLVPFGANVDATSNDPAVQNAAAASAKEQDLFAVLGPTYQAADWSTFYDAMARYHVITVPFENELGRSSAEFTSHAPYEWSFAPPTDVTESALANWACSTLAGQPASLGGSDVKAKTRSFAILRDQTAAGPVSDAALTQGMASCGQSVQVATIDSSTADDTTTQTALAKLRQTGATSIFLLGGLSLIRTALTNAYTLDYHPEWLTGGLGNYATNDFKLEGIENYRQAFSANTPWLDEMDHMFGLWSANRPLEYASAWWTQAMLQMNPTFTSNYESQFVAQDAAVYDAMQLLANGIQLAGPDLTAAAFQAGLFKTVFPDPGAGAAPYYQSGYGFGAGDYNASNDFAVVWWSNHAPPYNLVQGGAALTGSFCMVQRGARYRPGHWPAASTLFNPGAGCR